VREGRDVILTIHHQSIAEVKKEWISSLHHMASRRGRVQFHCNFTAVGDYVRHGFCSEVVI
jgi:hypothetical protein